LTASALEIFPVPRCGREWQRELAGGCAICCRCGTTVFARLPDPDSHRSSNVRAGACFNQWKLPDGNRASGLVKMLTDRISPILHGHKPEIQGAVLAELLATWLAGHVVPGDRMQTILLRGRLFHEHMKIVRDLTKLHAMRIELENVQGAGE
jgi:hypothetical protein